MLYVSDCPVWKCAVCGRNIPLHSDGRSDVYILGWYFYSNFGQHDSYEWH